MRSREHENGAFCHTRHEAAVKTRQSERALRADHLSLETKSGAQSRQKRAAGWWSDGYLLIGMLLSAQSMHTHTQYFASHSQTASVSQTASQTPSTQIKRKYQRSKSGVETFQV